MSDGAMRMKTEGKGTNSAVGSVKHHISRENRTGIPQQLKERMEQNTGLSFDDVRVHYNSALPKKLDALAYTKGNQVEIGPGQERHLPHELGHVVQQKLGLVRANAMHPSGVALNTDAGLERQADEIGAGKMVAIVRKIRDNIIQRCGGKKKTSTSGSTVTVDFSTYPSGCPIPSGPFTLLPDSEYKQNRKVANSTNQKLHKQNPDSKGKQYHEIKPVRFGGSPTDMSNKKLLSPKKHAEFTAFWNHVMREAKKGEKS